MQLDNRPVKLSDFSDEWAVNYKKEKELLAQCLKGFEVSIEHIGSTAITGAIAKPIIDIVIGIYDFKCSYEDVIFLLEGMGYSLISGVIKNLPKRRILWKGSDIEHTHHVHLTEKNGADWDDLIVFRNYISSNTVARNLYEKEKLLLANKFKSNISSYANGKEIIYKKLLLSAREWRR